MIRRILCRLGWHDMEIVFPHDDSPSVFPRLVGQDQCRCCGKKGRVY